MSQQDELARVKVRIDALAERTVERGCTEAEAIAAAEMIGRLLERYALSMDEIDVRETPCVETRVQAGGLRRRPIDTCVPAIARFCDCKVWLAREPTPPSYVFFGFETDTTLASYLFAVIDRAIRSELEGFRMRRPELGGMRLRQASSCGCGTSIGRWFRRARAMAFLGSTMIEARAKCAVLNELLIARLITGDQQLS